MSVETRDELIEKYLGVPTAILHESLHAITAIGLALPVRSMKIDADVQAGGVGVDHATDAAGLFAVAVATVAPMVFFVNNSMPHPECSTDLEQLEELRARYRELTSEPMAGEIEAARAVVLATMSDVLRLAAQIKDAMTPTGLDWGEAEVMTAVG